MLVGVPKEIKSGEARVGVTPGAASEYVAHGHTVLVETGAGAGIGVDDQAYVNAGAKIAPTAAEIFAKADMIVKVKEPQPQEWAQLRKGQILYTYLHLAADAEQARGLMQSGVTAVAYETVTDDARRPAAPRPDERGGRTPVDPGGGDGAPEAQRRARRAPRRRPRRAAGQGHRHRRRRGRHRGGADGGRRRRRGHRPRQVPPPAPRPRRHVPRAHPHPLLDPRRGRRGSLSRPTR